MQIVDQLYYYTGLVLYWGLLALRAWAVIDCATRKAAAFPAANKLTKPGWLAILVLSALIGTVLSPSPLGPLSLISVVAACVYLADVRPTIREITGGH